MGDRNDRYLPTQVGTDADWTQVRSGGEQTCGMRLNQTLWCWGNNSFGQLGVGDTLSRLIPAEVGGAADWIQVQLGYRHVCGVREDHTLWCWGWNQYGQLGIGKRFGGRYDYRDEPTQVGDVASWAKVVGGLGHTCAFRLDDSLWCWGYDEYGQLGLGQPHRKRYLSPARVGDTSDWTVIAAGFDFSCGIRHEGGLWCWGYNGAGKLGLGDTRTRYAPGQVGSDTDWAEVGAGTDHGCGLRRDHSLWCWGYNASGQLGLGVQQRRLVPVQV